MSEYDSFEIERGQFGDREVGLVDVIGEARAWSRDTAGVADEATAAAKPVSTIAVSPLRTNTYAATVPSETRGSDAIAASLTRGPTVDSATGKWTEILLSESATARPNW